MAKKRPAAADPPFISLTQPQRALLEERVAGPVRTILLGIAELTPAEGDRLCYWLQHYLPLNNWRLMPASEADQLEHDWRRAATAARYYRDKLKPDQDPGRTKRIIRLWGGGPKVKGGLSARQVWFKLKGEYPGLTRGAVQQVIYRHQQKQKKQRAAGL